MFYQMEKQSERWIDKHLQILSICPFLLSILWLYPTFKEYLTGVDLSLKEVDFSLKEVDFSLKELDFSLKEVDFSLKEVDFSLISP